mgnify:CR=1 FL=1
MIEVLPTTRAEVVPWIINIHYAHREPPISHAFGAYRGDEIIGVITYGVPSSAPLRRGVCGDEWKDCVLELNRLVCLPEKNLASILISRSIKQLPKPKIIISFADIAQGHVGYVYQATNWIYTGLSAKRTDWSLGGKSHGATVADMSRGHENRAEYMRGKYGDSFSLKERSRKHRYIYIHASRQEKRKIGKQLKYQVQPYPKGESARYDIESYAHQARLAI